MKKLFLLAACCIMLSSCATVFGGKISECQKTKPAPGKPKRELRVPVLLIDIFTGGLWTIVDFADGAIYKPCALK